MEEWTACTHSEGDDVGKYTVQQAAPFPHLFPEHSIPWQISAFEMLAPSWFVQLFVAVIVDFVVLPAILSGGRVVLADAAEDCGILPGECLRVRQQVSI